MSEVNGFFSFIIIGFFIFLCLLVYERFLYLEFKVWFLKCYFGVIDWFVVLFFLSLINFIYR